MKKAILITLGIAAVMTLASCRSFQETSDTAVTDILVTTRTAAADDAAAPAKAPVSTSAKEAMDSAKAGSTIEVTDAVNRTFKVSDMQYSFKIPRVTIPGVNTDDANNSMRNEIEKRFLENKTDAFDSEYNFYIGNKTVSVVVSNMDLFGGELIYEKVYNIDIKTGKLIPGSEVVRMSGLTDDEFFNKVKAIYTKYDNKELKNCTSKREKNYIRQNLKKISYKYIQPFIGDDGKLCFIGEVNCYGGAGYSYESFSVS